jgi:ribose transport system permease protein
VKTKVIPSQTGQDVSSHRLAGNESIGPDSSEVEAHVSLASTANPVAQADAVAHQGEVEPTPPKRRFSLGLDRFSGLYVWAGLILLFGIWVPDLFLTSDNARIIAGDQAITAMLALGLILPFAAGVFDLSIAGMVGLSVAIVAWMQSHGWHPVLSVVAAIAVAAAVGAINGIVVVRFRVNSFIATLGMSSILAAAAYWVVDGQTITEGFSEKFLNLGTKQLFGLPLPFYFMLVLAVVIYIVLEHLPIGRFLFATGGNGQAARLAGVRVDRIVFGSLVASASVAGLTGVVLAARLGTASADVGPSYLLPVFSAVFLGATQIKAGRVTVLGTLVAIYLLATGVKGLQLAGAPVYVNDLFNGAALIIAVSLAARTARRA